MAIWLYEDKHTIAAKGKFHYAIFLIIRYEKLFLRHYSPLPIPLKRQILNFL